MTLAESVRIEAFRYLIKLGSARPNRSIIWSAVGSLLSVLGVVSIVIVTRLVGGLEVARVVLVWLSAVSIMSATFRFGSERLIVPRLAAAIGNPSGVGPSTTINVAVVRNVLVGGVLGTGCLWILSTGFLGLPKLSFWGFAAIVIWLAFEGPLWILSEAARVVGSHATANLCSHGSRLVVASFSSIVIRPEGAEGFLTLVAVATLLITLLAWIRLSMVKLQPLNKARASIIKNPSWVDFALIGIASSVANNADLLFADSFSTAEQTVVYGLALRASFGFGLVQLIYTRAYVDRTVRDMLGGKQALLESSGDLKRVAQRSTGLTSILVFVTVCAWQFGLGRWLAGSDSQSGAILIAVFGLGYILNSSTGICGLLLTVGGDGRAVSVATAIRAVLGLLGFGMASHFGSLIALSAASAASMVAQNLYMWWEVRRRYGVDTSVAGGSLPDF